MTGPVNNNFYAWNVTIFCVRWRSWAPFSSKNHQINLCTLSGLKRYRVVCDWDLKARMLSFGCSLHAQNNCSEFRLPMTRLYLVFQSNTSFSLDSCIGYHNKWINQIFSIEQKCWMPPNFCASSLMTITILDFHSRPNTNCSQFRLLKTQLYKVFHSNVSISLDLCICHHKMLSNQFFSIRQKCWMPQNFSTSLLMNITILDFQSGPNTYYSEFRLPMTLYT